MTTEPHRSKPETSRPSMFGGQPEPVPMPWAWAVTQLVAARNYWIATIRPDGRPHTRPVWGVWLNNALYFSAFGDISLAAQNLAQNPAITVHLESGRKVVILEGTAAQITDGDLVEQVFTAYEAKYHWGLNPDNLPYEFRPQVAFGWLFDDDGLDGESAFRGTATRWKFS